MKQRLKPDSIVRATPVYVMGADARFSANDDEPQTNAGDMTEADIRRLYETDDEQTKESPNV